MATRHWLVGAGRPASTPGRGKSLVDQGSPAAGHRPWLRVRVGDYRTIYDVDDTTRRVTVAVVGHRREVYRSLDL